MQIHADIIITDTTNFGRSWLSYCFLIIMITLDIYLGDNNCSLVFNSTIWPLLQDCWVYRLELYTYLGWGGPSWENGTILPKGILHTQGWFLTLYVCVVVWCCSCSCCLPSWWSLSLLWLFFVICGGNSPLLGFLASFWSFGHLTVLQKNEKHCAKT